MARTEKQIIERVKSIIERNYDVVRWIDDDTALVHYWDEDDGDFYLEENVKDLLSNI